MLNLVLALLDLEKLLIKFVLQCASKLKYFKLVQFNCIIFQNFRLKQKNIFDLCTKLI
jgi:hypothetical protein